MSLSNYFRSACLAVLAVVALPYPTAVTAETTRLNVSITVFDPGVPADRSLHRDLQVFPRIRRIESLFLPFVLRETLTATGAFGAVRVVPETDTGAELLITGTVQASDGRSLELRLQAVDASGREWLDAVYAGTAPESYESSSAGLAGYQDLYDRIAADLVAGQEALDARDLTNIVAISAMRHAQQLAPSAFSEYLDSTADGTFTLKRLPARDDPMLERINRIRSVEYVMTDAIDEKFRGLHAEIASTYDLWRQYRRDYARYQREEREHHQDFETDAPRGSYEALLARYNSYKWDRLAAQEQEKWAIGFNNAVGPTVMAMEARVAEIAGWVDQNYAEWTRLLNEIFALETGPAR